MSEIVRFEKVSFQYPESKSIFEDISFNLMKGSFHYLTGASGAGKSTLIKLIYLGVRHYRGSICVFGRDLFNVRGSDLATYRQRMGIVFQDFLLLEHLSALDNVALPLLFQGASRIQARKKGMDLLNWIGLKGLSEVYPQNLSGGQQQRLAIARAVVGRPDLVIADEPTGNVDDENAVKLLRLFVELNRNGTTVIFATHNRDLMAEFPYPTLHLAQGKVQLLPTFYEERTALHA